jgi:hypothetical protein
MDPFVGTAIAQLAATGVLEAIKGAFISRAASRVEARGRDDELQRTYELATRLLGSLLFETRANIERVRLMRDGVNYGPFDFAVSDALMPELCHVAPSPAFLEQCRSVLAMLKRVDFFQRAAAHAVMDSPAGSISRFVGSAQDRLYARGKAFADDAMSKKQNLIARYNLLVKLGSELAGEVFKEGGTVNLLPGYIDPDSPIDQELV